MTGSTALVQVLCWWLVLIILCLLVSDFIFAFVDHWDWQSTLQHQKLLSLHGL